MIAGLLLVLGSLAPAQEESPLSSPEELRLDRRLDLDGIEAALSSLAARAGEHGQLERLGLSTGDRPIRLLRLTAPGPGAALRPALLFAATGAAQQDAEAVLAFGDLLVRGQAEDPVATLLAEHVVLLAPALDPDARVGAPRATRFERNFPLGWRPAALRPGSGDVPLSEPETRLAASLLDATKNLALIVGVVDGCVALDSESGPWPGAELPPADREVLRRLAEANDRAEGPRLLPWDRLGSGGGGFLDYAYQAYGIYPLAWRSPDARTPDDLAAWADIVARRTANLLLSLPRVSIEEEDLTELAPGLWQLDVAVRNGGTIPTLSALGAERFVGAELLLTLEGARVVATARRSSAEEPFQSARLHSKDGGAGLACGTLGGGETRWLRLVLEAERGSELELRGAAARAGAARLRVVLAGP